MKATSLALALVIFVAGCKSDVNRKAHQQLQPNRANAERRLADLIESFKNAVNDTNKAFAAIKEIASYPAVEDPNLWMDIAEDSRFSDYQRAKALVTFFTRHLRSKTPMALVDLLRFRKMDTLLTESNLVTATAFSYVPLNRFAGGSLYMIQPDYLRKNRAAVYLSVKRSPPDPIKGGIGADEFLECVRDIKKAKLIRVIEVGLSE